jgi:cationic amino acid transporter 1
MNVPGLGEYPDLLAFAIVFGLTVMLAIGVRESTRFHAVFTVLNMVVVVYLLVVGGIHSDITNWNLNATEVPASGGDGGFLPFGFHGLMSGAATCFYAFVGFDVIATMGEEVKNPRKNIPISICVSLFIVSVVYMSVAAVQTLMWPYWDQDRAAPLPYIFEQLDMPVAKWIVAVGALTGLSSALLGSLFPLPRVMYAMAGDGLIFRFFAIVHPRFQTPLIATFVSGLLAAIMAAIFSVNELADMMSIGTLNAYSLVSFCVLILRYHEDFDEDDIPTSVANRANAPEAPMSPFDGQYSPGSEFYTLRSRTISPPVETAERLARRPRSGTHSKSHQPSIGWDNWRRFAFNLDNSFAPSPTSVLMSKILICLCTALVIMMDVILILCADLLYAMDKAIVIIILVLILIAIVLMVAIARQPKAEKFLAFEVPMVPLIPILSIMANFYLAFSLSSLTWIRFLVWFLMGMVVYFSYGIWNSNERMKVRLAQGFDVNGKKKLAALYSSNIPQLEIIEATPENTVKVY